MDGTRTEVRDGDGRLLAYKVSRDSTKGLAAYSEPSDYVQLLSWNYGAGERLAAHKHRKVPRISDWTQEVIVVVNGTVRADIYDENKTFVGTVRVEAGECLVLLAGCHGYQIEDEGTRVFEIKNGPYPGAEIDRVRI